MIIVWQCPYCGQEQTVSDYSDIKSDILHNPKSSFLLECDEEDGGCGKRSVVDFRIIVEIKSRKIEGEQ